MRSFAGKPQPLQKFLDVDHGKGFIVAGPAFSPDGHWVAYSSVAPGMAQIYVAPFPGPGGRWQVSTDGGIEPRWSKTGHELFYIRPTSMMVVTYSVDKGAFQPGKPQKGFEDRFEIRSPFLSYDVSADGQDFVVIRSSRAQTTSNNQPTFVVNWLDDVRRQVAAGQSNSPK